VNDLGAAALHNAAHDVDGGIVAIKQGGGSNETNFVVWLIWCGLLHNFRSAGFSAAKVHKSNASVHLKFIA
jgi:hypothetical protein